LSETRIVEALSLPKGTGRSKCEPRDLAFAFPDDRRLTTRFAFLPATTYYLLPTT